MTHHSNDSAIRARAYQLWIESGYADGYQDAHWRQAEREIAERQDSDDPERPIASPAPHPLHTDGLSRFPSVLDPKPSTAGH